MKNDFRAACASALLTAAGITACNGADTNWPPPFVIDGQVGAAGLSGSEKALLAQNGVVIQDQNCRQIFDVYNKCPAPFYITADSVLQAFNLVLEDCIRKQERANTDSLLSGLTKVQSKADSLYARTTVRVPQDDDAKQLLDALVFLSGVVTVAGQLLDSTGQLNFNGFYSFVYFFYFLYFLICIHSYQ